MFAPQIANTQESRGDKERGMLIKTWGTKEKSVGTDCGDKMGSGVGNEDGPGTNNRKDLKDNEVKMMVNA